MALPRVQRCITSRPVRLAVFGLAAAVALAGCSSEPSATDVGVTPATTPATTPTPTTPTVTTPAPTTPTPTTPTATTPTVTTAASPEDALEARITFLLGLLSDPAGTTDDEIAANVSPLFLAQLPPPVLRSETVALTAGIEGPWTEQDREPTPTGAAVEVAAADGTRMILVVDVDPEPPHQIVGAQLLPAIDELFAEPGTIDEVDAALADTAARVDYGIYDVGTGECSAVREAGGGRVFPTASAFKLWVLAAVAEAVERGEVAWDDIVVVDPALRSSPDGEIDELPDGSEVTVQRLAEAMISVSDNTATDHLIAFVGREAVERTIAGLGVSTAERNVPLLTTRELFQLRLIDPGLTERYLALDSADERRRFLDEDVAVLPLPWAGDALSGGDYAELAAGLSPALIDDIEWFATAHDLCVTLVELDRLAREPGLEQVAEILELNPGLPFPPGTWEHIRFKGGSEAGVFTLAYWFESPGGARRVAVLALSDPAAPIDETAALVAATRFVALVPAVD